METEQTGNILNWLDKIPYALLVVLSLTVGLAPFTPMPHLAEKLIMLASGRLVRPLDVLDLVFHACPIVLLVLKFAHRLSVNRKG
jgi:hypothetical protein